MAENKLIERIAEIFKQTKIVLDNVGSGKIEKKQMVESVASALGEDVSAISHYVVDYARQFGTFSRGRSAGWRRGLKNVRVVKGPEKVEEDILDEIEDSEE